MRNVIGMFIVATVGLLTAGVASAAVIADDAWVEMPLPGSKTTAAYMVLRNTGDRDVDIVAAASNAAAAAEIHEVIRFHGIPAMRRILPVRIPAHGMLALRPGHMHLMLSGLKGRWRTGRTVPIILITSGGRHLTFTVIVRHARSDLVKAQALYALAMRQLRDHDSRGAFKLMREAATLGNRRAQYQLGLLYARGEGGGRDLKKARRWLQKAAMQGHPKAQFYLGRMYVVGDGGDRDPVLATMWFWLATTLGDRYAKDALRVMSGKLDPRKLEEAKRRAGVLWHQIPHDMKIKRRMAMH